MSLCKTRKILFDLRKKIFLGVFDGAESISRVLILYSPSQVGVVNKGS